MFFPLTVSLAKCKMQPLFSDDDKTPTDWKRCQYWWHPQGSQNCEPKLHISLRNIARRPGTLNTPRLVNSEQVWLAAHGTSKLGRQKFAGLRLVVKTKIC